MVGEDFPILRTGTQPHRFDQLITTLVGWLTEPTIYLGEYQELRRALNRAVDSANHHHRQLFQPRPFNSLLPPVQTLLYNLSLHGLHSSVAAQKRLQASPYAGEIAEPLRAFIVEVAKKTVADPYTGSL